MKIICLLTTFLFYGHSYAQWSADSLELLNEYEAPFENALLSTVWGNITTIRYINPPEVEFINLRKKKFKSHHFSTNKLPYMIGEDENWTGPRPLMVFNPGVFSRLKDGQAKDILKRFVNLGYMTISFPNTLSVDYIKQGPKFELLDMDKVAHIHLELIQAKIKELEKKGKIKRPYLLGGISFGGFVSATMYAQDAEKKLNLFDSYFSFSPPMDFIKAVDRLDKLFYETRDSTIGQNFWQLVRGYIRIRRLNIQDPYEDIHIQSAKDIVAQYVFKDSLIDSLKEYQKWIGEEIVPKDKEEFKKWRKNLRFEDAFQKFSPYAFEDLQKTRGRFLFHWLNRARKAGHNKIKVLSCEDDIIHDGIDHRIGLENEILKLPYGGHIGYRSLKWFDRLVQAEFSF